MSQSRRGKFTVVKQICDLIPGYLVPKLATKHKVRWRAFSPWSHITAMISDLVKRL